MKIVSNLLLGIGLAFGLSGCHPPPSDKPQEVQTKTWQKELQEQLPMLGHRNWILVVDKAYPLQSSSGIDYIYADENLPSVLDYVMKQLNNSTHVRPVAFTDKELSYITEQQASGVEEFRKELNKTMEGNEVQTLAHDSVFRLLDQSSKLFKVLVIKTNQTIPYSSVFLQLDCRYWDANRENQLRQRMK